MDQFTPPITQKRTVTPIVILIACILLISLAAGSYFLFFRDKISPKQYEPEPSEAVTLPELQELQPLPQTNTTSSQRISVPPTTTGETASSISTSTGSGARVTGSPTTQQITTTIPWADRPTLKIGEKWIWTNRSETYLGEENDLLSFSLISKIAGTVKRYRTKDLNLVKDINDMGVVSNLRSPHAGTLAFPLTVGKQWTHQYTSDNTPRTATYKVKGYAKLLTAIGQLDAFKIEGTDKRSDRSYGIAVTLWYAPEAHAIVISSGIDQSNDGLVSGWNYELTGHTSK